MSPASNATHLADRGNVATTQCPHNTRLCSGSNGTRHRTGTIVDPRHLMTQGSATGIPSLKSAALMRTQMREAFLKIYFPVADHAEERDFMYSRLLSREVLQAHGGAMVAATDTLILLQVGTAFDESPLITEARKRYSIARAGLRRALLQSKFSWSDEAIAVMYILGFCDIPLICDGEWPKRSHHDMLEDMLRTWGPQSQACEQVQRLVENFRHMTAMFGCTRRKSVALVGKDWRQYSGPTDEFMKPLSDFITEGPSLIERADLAAQGRIPDISQVTLELAQSESRLKAWLFAWYHSNDGSPYRSEDMDSFPNMSIDFDRDLKTFPKAFRFPSFFFASAHGSYWIMMLRLKAAMLEIARSHQTLFDEVFQEKIIQEANECADSLCQTIACLVQPQYGLCGINRAIGPLKHAAIWYSKQHHTQKAEWCEVIRVGLESCSATAPLFHNFSRRREEST